TFLFHRDFMEYHSDRFRDFSLLIFEGEKLVAVMPANRAGEVLHSHQGLTYGGLVLETSIGGEKVEEIFKALRDYLNDAGINSIKIKQILSIYHKTPAYELDYILYKHGGGLYRKDMNLAIDYSRPLAISKSKLKHFRRISAIGLEIRMDNDFGAFWNNVLIPRLAEKHNAKPVHTLDEIKLLHDRFPKNIIQYNVYHKDRILAGITLFNFENVVKSQYGATTNEGEKLRALDYLFITLIEEFKDKTSFFDMGTVTEGDGDYNKGLLKQKEELGCSIYTQDFYEIRTD
ncbi:MAG TPA: FemAB family protein, partial [Flavobacterium sp.]|nr:FemAB family protein [Flavobacterium sp.]